MISTRPKPCPPPVRVPAPAPTGPHRLTWHVMKQAAAKDIPLAAVQAAADDHGTEYPAKGHGPHCVRRVLDGVAVVVDTRTREVVTVYAHAVLTDIRPDQRDARARAHAATRAS